MNTTETPDFSRFFLHNSTDAIAEYQSLISSASNSVSNFFKNLEKPYEGLSPREQMSAFKKLGYFPEAPTPLADTLQLTENLVLKNTLSVTHENCLAHLHCPVLLPSLAAEVIISATNQSMDSWDQAPGASMLEQCFSDELCKLFGYGEESDAIFTSGGTQSNFMGLMLARDYYAFKNLQWDIQKAGLPAEASRFRFICSDVAHFSVQQSAAILGLGHNAVVTVETDENFRMKPQVLKEKIELLKSEGLLPIAVVGTAGTTDFGSIDPLKEIAEIAEENGIWFHIDAAFGGALILSETFKNKLDGISKADSITVDFHKLFFQPISCSAFLLKDKSRFMLMNLNAEYLNPESNVQHGILDLVYKSIQTTRRFDVLKPFLTLQMIGRKTMGEIIDYTLHLAQQTAEMIKADVRFELAAEPSINTVVFRYLPSGDFANEEINEINSAIKIDLLLKGDAVIGQTGIGGNAFLKFTLMNPLARIEHIEKLLNVIAERGAEIVEKGVFKKETAEA
jgi:L-2,4-diaminobutyrate decarboxylase